MAYVDEVLADEPVGYWNFDNADYTDQSGSGFNGTAVGTLGVGGVALGDPLGLALECGGGRVQIGNQAALQLQTLTLEAWIFTTKNDGDYQSVIYKDSAYQMFVRNGRFICHDRGTDRDSGVTVADGSVHHIALAQRVPPLTSTMYVDGQPVAEVTMGVFNQTQALALGGFYSGGLPFIGYLDELAVYPHIVSAERILAHYEVGSGLGPQGFLGVWTGSDWERKPMFWNGGGPWMQKPVKRWNGSEWVLTP